MSKNEYFPYESAWTLNEWSGYCPNLEYRVKKPDEFPPFLPKTLTEKFNCAMVAASGNHQYQTFVFQGYRVDSIELDEHQYIATFDILHGTCYAGFIEHADYPGRTTQIPQEMLNIISLSGISVDFRFERRPPNPSGSINELLSGGLISGFVNSVNVQTTKDINSSRHGV